MEGRTMIRFAVFFILVTISTGVALALANTHTLHSGNIGMFFLFYILAILSSTVVAVSFTSNREFTQID